MLITTLNTDRMLLLGLEGQLVDEDMPSNSGGAILQHVSQKVAKHFLSREAKTCTAQLQCLWDR